MRIICCHFFSSLGCGARALLLTFAFVFPVAMIGHYSHSLDLYRWGTFCAEPVWQGEVWRLSSYGFLPMGIVDWLVSLFWLTTLVCVLGRTWSGFELWSYCLLSTLVAGLLMTLLRQPTACAIGGNGAMILALIAAWARLYGNERIILLGIGEMSVRQAAVIVSMVELLILFFCLGWIVTLAMLCGGLAGWFYLFARGRNAMNRRSRLLDSERIARLEI